MTSPRILLKAWNLRPQKKLGQNFLADLTIAQRIVARARIENEDVVFEIGAGLGALTIPIARQAAKVIAIEKDRNLVKLLKTELAVNNLTNVDLRADDIRRLNLGELLQAIERKVVVMGNLPYNLSSQILVQLIGVRQRVDRAILMFQKELAERMIAPPGGRDYGRLAVMLQYCAAVKPVVDVKAAQFFPRPQIDSTVLEIDFGVHREPPAEDETLLFRVVKAAFAKRRKTLKNALSRSELPIGVSQAEAALEQSDIDPRRRAETLHVHEFVTLSNCLAHMLGN
jgi:16S rRNA (adenine1518-N6/adenine1519-N6)-dimethyltransferase